MYKLQFALVSTALPRLEAEKPGMEEAQFSNLTRVVAFLAEEAWLEFSELPLQTG